MQPNPFDPRKRNDLTPREKIVLRFTDEVLHGDNMDLIDEIVSPDYRQHTSGIGQGRQGLRNYLKEVAWRRAERYTWQPIQIFESGDFVILHKLLPLVVIADFFRFDNHDMLVEHWDVVQPVPHADYDPMGLSEEDFTRFYALFSIAPNLA
jgi:predicted SnoaL-like aldol condensation-catalyzing enzyme